MQNLKLAFALPKNDSHQFDQTLWEQTKEEEDDSSISLESLGDYARGGGLAVSNQGETRKGRGRLASENLKDDLKEEVWTPEKQSEL